MTCPYCGAEMTPGYIQSRDGVYWDTKKRLVAALPPRGGDAVILGTGGGPFSGAAVLAYHCTKCKKILIDYSQNNP